MYIKNLPQHQQFQISYFSLDVELKLSTVQFQKPTQFTVNFSLWVFYLYIMKTAAVKIVLGTFSTYDFCYAINLSKDDFLNYPEYDYPG